MPEVQADMINMSHKPSYSNGLWDINFCINSGKVDITREGIVR